MPDEATPEETAQESGADLSLMLGEINILYKLGLPPTASAEDVLKALIEKAPGGEAGEGEGGAEEATAAASDLRVLFKLEDDADMAAIVAAARTAVDKVVLSADSVKALSERVGVMEADKQAEGAETAIAKYIADGKIIRADEEHLKVCQDWANRDLKGFSNYLDTQPRVVPQSGAIAGPRSGPTTTGSREQIIRGGKREYAGDLSLAMGVCSEREFVNQGLRDSGLGLLSDEEVATFTIAA